MISVIIPTLQEERYVGRLMRDLSKQKNVQFEVIIADALSADKTAEVAKENANGFKLTIVKTVHRNPAHQRNIGSMYAEGDVFVFLDADIRIDDPQFLANIRRHLRSAAAGFTPVKVHPSIATIGDIILTETANMMLKYLNPIMCLGGRGACQVVRRKAFFAVNGYREDFGIGEDCDFIKRLSKIGRIKHLPFPVYESPRRYRELGHIRTCMYWISNWIHGRVQHRGLHKSWKAVQ